MATTPTTASLWAKLSEEERRQRIRDHAITDLSTLGPDLRAIVDEMLASAPRPSAD